jgi:cell division protease FtsH
MIEKSKVLAIERTDKAVVDYYDLFQAWKYVKFGQPNYHNENNDPEELMRTAIHESGHAVVAHEFPKILSVAGLTLECMGNFKGACFFSCDNKQEMRGLTKKDVIDKMSVSFGGLVAEEKFFGSADFGSFSDIKKAKEMAKFIGELGMTADEKKIFFADNNEGLKKNEEIMQKALKIAEDVVEKNKAKIKTIAEHLVKHKNMDYHTFENFMNLDTNEERLDINEEQAVA